MVCAGWKKGGVGTLGLCTIGSLQMSRVRGPRYGRSRILMGIGCYKVYKDSVPEMCAGNACRFPAIVNRRFSKVIRCSPRNRLGGGGITMFPLLPYFRYRSYGGKGCTSYDSCSCCNSEHSKKVTRCVTVGE